MNPLRDTMHSICVGLILTGVAKPSGKANQLFVSDRVLGNTTCFDAIQTAYS